MQLSVGAIKYTIRRVFDLRLDGEISDGMYDAHRRIIWLNADLDRDRWYEILRHEYQHAWHHHVGRGKSDESDAKLASLIDETFKEQLESGGGIDALDDVPCEGNRSPNGGRVTHSPTAIASDNRTCGVCETDTAAGSINTSSPIEIAPGSWIVDRWFRCNCCRHVMVWRERADTHGVPTGSVVGGHIVPAGEPADAWEAEHGTKQAPAYA